MDDHPIVRMGLRMLVEATDDLSVCGEAEDVAGAVAVIADTAPDVAVVDIGLKNGSGIDLCRRLHDEFPAVTVLVCSGRDETLYAERMIELGARGYVRKEQSAEELVNAIRAVAEGRLYLGEAVRQRLLSKFVEHGDAGPTTSRLQQLSNRELEVLDLMGEGVVTARIGERLGISRKTVESYQESLKKKLSLDNVHQLIRIAVWHALDGGLRTGAARSER